MLVIVFCARNVKINFLVRKPIFNKQSTEQLKNMVEAGLEVLNCHRVLAKTGDNLVGELLKGYDDFFEWDHYPKGDVIDKETHCQMFYHSHKVGEREAEHGHFHTFLHKKAFPKKLSPKDLPDKDQLQNKHPLTHLIGISMDQSGIPFRLFTVNRWVTGEVWYDCEDIIAAIDNFEIDIVQPSWVVNIWLSNMVQLFRPQIIELLHERDKVVNAWVEKNPDKYVYEDRELEVTSVLDVSVDGQINGAVDELAIRDVKII